ncbi:MAG TPA: hypothetical protein VML55_10690 [Planctomycetaceae bacterium]|nr:hypothetical protein [Planctomycetaceae bacterium]
MSVLLVCLLLADPADAVILDRPAPAYRTGHALVTELEATIPAAAWQGVEFRRILRRLAADRRVAVLLDRRIDPNRTLTLEVSRQRVADVFADLASGSGAAVSVAANSVYIGPPAAVARLRTVIELRTTELRQLTARRPRGRRLELFDRGTVYWNDLDEPRGIVHSLAERYKVRIINADAVPYDLWAAATLPDVNLAEALSLVLIQFDLTFRWADSGDAVELVPLPADVFLERTYRPRGLAPEQAAAAWTREFAGLRADARGASVVVRGTLEQHESIERLVSGRRPARPDDGSRPPPRLDVKQRTFTIRQRVTAAALIETLEKSGIQVEYDAEALAAAGVELQTPIELDVTQAGADEFFRAWCGPLGLEFEIEGLTVRLFLRHAGRD